MENKFRKFYFDREIMWFVSLMILLILWQTISLLYPPSFIPDPKRVLKEIFNIFAAGDFFFHMYHTMIRVIAGFFFSFIISIILAIAMGTNRFIEMLFELWVVVGLTIPGLAWAIISLIWFGITEASAIFSIIVIVTPMIIVTILEGVKALDSELVDMARTFRANNWLIIKDVIIPQLIPYFLSATRFGLAFSWKVVVISELLGLSNGIGYMINYNYGLFSMVGVLAWTISFTMIMFLLEFFLIRPAEKRVTRWRPISNKTFV
jgi:NitT/TauT family transport system permease protein